MVESSVEYDTDGRVGIVTIDRPPVNALRYEDLESLAERFDSLPSDDELAVVLTGEGERAFVGGHDVNEFEEAPAEVHTAGTETYERVAEAIYECPLPTIAAVDGAALGTGMVLACLCDLRVASPDAAFGLPEIDVGVVAGLSFASRVLPDGVARGLVYTGEPIPGERTYELGMVGSLSETPVAEATTLAKTVAAKSPDAVLAAKRLAIEQQLAQPIECLRREREVSEELLQQPNGREAVRSFLEDRKPKFER